MKYAGATIGVVLLALAAATCSGSPQPAAPSSVPVQVPTTAPAPDPAPPPAPDPAPPPAPDPAVACDKFVVSVDWRTASAGTITNTSQACTVDVLAAMFWTSDINLGFHAQELADYKGFRLAPGDKGDFSLREPECGDWQADVLFGVTEAQVRQNRDIIRPPNSPEMLVSHRTGYTRRPCLTPCKDASVSVSTRQTEAAVEATFSFNWTGGADEATATIGAETMTVRRGQAVTRTLERGPSARSLTATLRVEEGCEGRATVEIPPLTFFCTPATQTVGIGVPAAMSASGGTGSYSWSAPGGTPSTGGGASFSTAYATAGSFTVTVTSGTQTATCRVVTELPPCTNAAIASSVVEYPATVDVSATFTWTGGPGSATATIGAETLTVSRGATIVRTFAKPAPGDPDLIVDITLNAGAGCTAATSLRISALEAQLTCSPAQQKILSGATAVFTASGGTGSYTWVSTGIPSSGSGAIFSATFTANGTATVTSGTLSATCSVFVR